MWLFKVVVLVFSLYLATVVADEVTCESESGGTCNLASYNCRIEHADDNCTSASRSLNRPIPSTPVCGECPGQVNSSSPPMVPILVNVSASPFDSYYFNVHVSWSVYQEDYEAIQGFRVRLKQRNRDDNDADRWSDGCVCLNATQRNYSFTYNQHFQYVNNYYLSAEVMILPVRSARSEDEELNTRTAIMPFPSSCYALPYDPIHCRLQLYSSPRNVRAYRSIHRMETSTEKSIRISWEPPESQHPEPTMYYVQVNDHDVSGYNYIFKTTNTTSVSVHHLNTSIMYQVRVRTYVPCSGPPSYFGCSFATSWVQVMSEPSSSTIPPIPMLSSTMVTESTPSSTLVAMTTASTPSSTVVAMTTVSTHSPVIPESGTPPSGNNIAIPVAGSVGGALLVVIIVLISIIIAVKRRVHKQSSYEILPSTSIDDHSPPQLIVRSGCPQHDSNETVTVQRDYSQHDWNSTLPVQSDHCQQNASHTALVVYSLDSSERDEHLVLQYLISDLRKYYIAAVTPKNLQRGNLPFWIEEQVKKADAVLCVCNEAFFKEWTSNPSTVYTSRAVAHSLKSFIGGTLSQSKDLSKFGIVLLKQSDKQFIPSTYLAGTQSFLIDETENIARFVAEVSHFE